MALAVVPQVIYSDGNPWRVFAIVLCTPPACFAISWLSSRGRWLSKSEDADDPRYSHFRDIGGFVSIYALIIYFFFSSSLVMWAAKGPINCARPWMTAWATLALAGLAVAAFVAFWTTILTRIRGISIAKMRRPTRYTFTIAMVIAAAATGFFVVSALVTQFDFIDGIWRVRSG